MTSERKKKLTTVLNKRQPDLTVIMENVNDPHNIAAVMRSCDAVGIQDIYVLNTRMPAHRKWGTRTSSSANKWLTVHSFVNLEDCFSAVRERYRKVYTTFLDDTSVGLHAMDFTESIALVFGNEKHGVSSEAVQSADGNFVIPQVGMISSLNISVACAVTLYEAFRQKSEAGHYDYTRLEKERVDEIKKGWKMYDTFKDN